MRADLTVDRDLNIVIDDERPMIICAWHRWEYDLHTGRGRIDGAGRVQLYPVETDETGTGFLDPFHPLAHAAGQDAVSESRQ